MCHTRMNESCVTHECISHVSHTNESVMCHTRIHELWQTHMPQHTDTDTRTHNHTNTHCQGSAWWAISAGRTHARTSMPTRTRLRRAHTHMHTHTRTHTHTPCVGWDRTHAYVWHNLSARVPGLRESWHRGKEL